LRVAVLAEANVLHSGTPQPLRTEHFKESPQFCYLALREETLAAFLGKRSAHHFTPKSD
jgi:hypothetical protein